MHQVPSDTSCHFPYPFQPSKTDSHIKCWYFGSHLFLSFSLNIKELNIPLIKTHNLFWDMKAKLSLNARAGHDWQYWDVKMLLWRFKMEPTYNFFSRFLALRNMHNDSIRKRLLRQRNQSYRIYNLFSRFLALRNMYRGRYWVRNALGMMDRICTSRWYCDVARWNRHTTSFLDFSR